ncbi:MAG: hypothetical protein OCC45_10390 [Desulfotalea sp.]
MTKSVSFIVEPEEAVKLENIDHLELLQVLNSRSMGMVGLIRQAAANNCDLSPSYLSSCMEQIEGNLILLERITLDAFSCLR